MRDLDVRAAVRLALQLAHQGDASTRIVEEMGIWAGSVRVDIAVINGELQGYELKSARDTLARLPAQTEIYSQVFDRVTLVSAEKHLAKASQIVPEWWGLSAAVEGGELVKLTDVRTAAFNPCHDPVQVARLLWRTEALAILEQHDLASGVRSKPVEVLHRQLAASLSLSDLRAEVRSTLKSRANWLRQLMTHERDVPA